MVLCTVYRVLGVFLRCMHRIHSVAPYSVPGTAYSERYIQRTRLSGIPRKCRDNSDTYTGTAVSDIVEYREIPKQNTDT